MLIARDTINQIQAARVRAWIATLTPISRLSPRPPGVRVAYWHPHNLTEALAEDYPCPISSLACGLACSQSH